MKGEWIREPKGDASAIFVHGILSSGETCWLHANGSYWPELLKDEPELAPLGIYVFTYETGIFSGSYRVSNIVDALKEHMQLDGVLESKQLIFVCHSMGGIVVRKYIVERQAELIGAGKEIDLFLVASPSLGSSYADWLSPLAKLFGHAQADVLRFVRNNDWLMDLDKEFKNLKEGGTLKIKGKELVEDKFVYFKKFWRKQVVEALSGAPYFGESYKVPNSDHFSIAKPKDKTEDQHRLLCQFIKHTVKLSGPADKNQPTRVLSQFATKVQRLASHDDLVVPQNIHDELRAIVAESMNQPNLAQQWNVTRTSHRNGLQVLFYGGRGTGKTLAARVIANELRADLYKLNYTIVKHNSAETARDLQTLFEEVTMENLIILISDAEILFGLQSNILGMLDISGNLIFTSTKRPELNQDLVQLVSHTVEFPFPDKFCRKAIWTKAIPADLPIESFDFSPELLGERYRLSGGDIEKAVYTAAALAKQGGYSYVTMKHFESAAAKLQKRN